MTIELLLHCNGTDGGTIFTNAAPTSHTVSWSYTTTSTSQAVFGTAGCALDVSGAWLNFDNTYNWAWGTRPWNIDFWLKPTSDSSPSVPFFISGQPGSSTNFSISINGGYNIFVDVRVGGVTYSATITKATYGIVNNTYFHLGVGRDGDTIRTYINGVAGPTITLPANASIDNATSAWYVGPAASGRLFYIDELCVRMDEFVDFSSTGVPAAEYVVPIDGGGTLGELIGSAVMQIIGEGELQELSGASTMAIPIVCGGPLKETTGDGYGFSVSLAAGGGLMNELKGLSLLGIMGGGSIHELSGYSDVIHEYSIDAGGQLWKLYGGSTGYSTHSAIGGGFLKKLDGVAETTAFLSFNCGGGVSELSGLALSRSEFNTAGGLLHGLLGSSKSDKTTSFGDLRYVRWTVRK